MGCGREEEAEGRAEGVMAWTIKRIKRIKMVCTVLGRG